MPQCQGSDPERMKLTHKNITKLKEAMDWVLNVVTTWWRHQMETFYAWLVICAGNSRVTGEFRAKKPATRSFDIFFDLRLNKQLSKQSWGWWFETPSRLLWRHCNEKMKSHGLHTYGQARQCRYYVYIYIYSVSRKRRLFIKFREMSRLRSTG